MTEERLAHFTEWARKRPNSIEFWEVFLTTERVTCCFVGESFSSALLRADMGEHAREELAGRTIEEIAAYDERNFEIPLSNLDSLTLTRGTRIRRARLEFEWDDDELALYNTKAGSSQEELVESLANEPRLDATVGITDPSSLLDRS